MIVSAPLIMGVEVEYAITPLSTDVETFSREAVVRKILARGSAELVALRDHGGSGLFLSNGSRFYLDVGSHPEISSPECQSPFELVRYLRAGDQILQRLAREIVDVEPELQEILVLAGNVDYLGGGASWGCHESYMYRREAEDLVNELTPHLVSRIVYSGAGGFRLGASVPEFTISPRAAFTTRVLSRSTTESRGLISMKNESLAGTGSSRLHLICGENLRSELATVLKVGTTALVLALADAGFKIGSAVAIRRPIVALSAFAADPSCKAAFVQTARGRMRAIDIQRHYLEGVEAHLSHECMPEWAPRLCSLWGETLDGLDADPMGLSTRLDWPMKRMLFGQHIAQWKTSGAGDPAQQMQSLIRLREELIELDTRFSVLGETGVFEILDSGGVLNHRLAEAGDIAEAQVKPPPGGRAQLRGELIAALHGESETASCGWTSIVDWEHSRETTFPDPMATTCQWCSQKASAAYRGEHPDLVAFLASEGM